MYPLVISRRNAAEIYTPGIPQKCPLRILEDSHPQILPCVFSARNNSAILSAAKIMPPKQIRGNAVGRPQQRGGYARQVIDELTSPENRSVVTAVGFFAV